MTGPERIAHNETLPASPDLGLDPDPRVPDGWWDEPPQMLVVYPAPVSGRLLGLLVAAASGALVGLLAGFLLAGVVSAAPRSAPPVVTGWALIEASHVPSGNQPAGEVRESAVGSHRYPDPVRVGASQAPSTNRNGPASVEPSPDPNTSGAIGTAAIGGQATWYCGAGSPCTVGYGPSDLVAAIDPTLGIRRGERLTVRYRGRSVEVVVVDVCQCGGSRIIDLSRLAFSQLADPSLGVIPVSIQLSGPAVRLPETDR